MSSKGQLPSRRPSGPGIAHSASPWLDVDRQGLAAILERRGKEFAVLELIQNAWDTNTNTVNVSLSRLPGQRYARLIVTDDDPDGFADLRHSFTLFAPSIKKSDPTKRGRFNLGEKLVLALCKEATITSTRGAVTFDEEQGRRILRRRTARGTVFDAVIRLTKDEVERALAATKRLIVPDHITLFVNGEAAPHRIRLHTFETTLQTEVADEDGFLRRTQRKTRVDVYDLSSGETAHIFELGIPVVETGDAYHYDVQQKVPVNLERDNVPPAYLSKLRTLVLNELHDRLNEESANATWAQDALSNPDIAPQAVVAILDHRFGERRVSYDPSDPEANRIAVAQGYTIVPGGAFNRKQWQNIRAAGAVKPAGKVTPSPKPYGKSGQPLVYIPRDTWDAHLHHKARYTQAAAHELLGCAIEVCYTDDADWGFGATYGNSTMTFNLGCLGRSFFEGDVTVAFDALLIHELAHHRVSNHLSTEYYDECCLLGARLAHWGERATTAIMHSH